MKKFAIKVNGDVTLSKLVEAESLDKAVDQARVHLKSHNYSYTVFEIPSYIQKMSFA
jgi:hypothetical protein